MRIKIFVYLFIIMGIFAACSPITSTGSQPTISADQIKEPAIIMNTGVLGEPLINGASQATDEPTIYFPEVISVGPGWVVIHADNNSSPGEIIGYSHVHDGLNVDVYVLIDLKKATPNLYAILNQDKGKPNVFEYPGPDQPEMVNGHIVLQSFAINDMYPGMFQITGTPIPGGKK